jgi:uncharacterized membrane protein YhaH (DUF805 family)
MSSTPVEQEDDPIESRLPLWMAILANSLSLVLSVQFFWVPPGASIRPMGYAVWIVVIGAGALLVLPLVLLNLKRLRGRTWPKYAIVLALTPVPLGILVSRLAQLIIGFQFSQ